MPILPHGSGALIRVFPASPAAGLEIVYASPLRTRRRLLEFSATLITSAAVAARTPLFFITTQSSTSMIVPGQRLMAASDECTFYLQLGWNGVPYAITTASQILNLPENAVMRGDSTFQTSTIGILGGDQWSAVTFLFEEWIEP